MNERAKKILEFWFIKSSINDWFEKKIEFDKKIRENFWKDYERAVNNEYDDWQDNPKECVALVILLDQFSRNLFRNSDKAFKQDYKSRLITNEAVDRGYLEELELDEIQFLLLPLIHSEDINDHIFGHKLIDTYLKKHGQYDLIKRAWNDHTIPIKKFGRYPHRNKILERKSTSEEEIFLKQPNSAW